MLREVESVLILACGTSYHAGLVARYWLEAIAGTALQRRDRQRIPLSRSVPHPNALVITISQSGETADTMAALQYAKSLGQEHTLTICNVAGKRR